MAFTTAEFSILAFQLQQRPTPGEIVLRLEFESPHCPLAHFHDYEPRNIQSGSWVRSEIESIAGITYSCRRLSLL